MTSVSRSNWARQATISRSNKLVFEAKQEMQKRGLASPDDATRSPSRAPSRRSH